MTGLGLMILIGLMVMTWLAGAAMLRVFADPRPRHASSRGTAARRVVSILVVGALAAGAISLFSPTHRVSTPPQPGLKLARLPAYKLRQEASASAVDAAAKAGYKALLADRHQAGFEPVAVHFDGPDLEESTQPEPMPGVAIRIRVKGAPHSTPEKALAASLEQAHSDLSKKLREMDPPIAVVPPVEVIRREYVRPGSVRDILPTPEIKELWRNDGLGENRQWAEVDVEVSDSQLRGLRGQQRTADGGLVAGTALAAFAALFGFLRLDGWTKGYLTTTLALAAAALVGGAVAFLEWVR